MSHLTLAELQAKLQNFLLDQQQNIDGLTLTTPNFSAEERLGIYHEAYRLRLIDALRNDYPALALHLGDPKFVELATEFIAQCPSQHPSLRWLGEKLPSFLNAHSHWKQEPETCELAAFEWAQSMAFDAADTSLASIDDLRALQPEQWMNLQLEFHPSLQLVSCYSNAPARWNALVKDNQPLNVEIKPEAQDWLIWREELQVVYRPLVAAEASSIRQFMHHHNFADVCSCLCEWFDEADVPMQAAQYLQQWIRTGLITAVISHV